MSLVTSYQTFWGNALQGVYITWIHNQADVANLSDLSTAELKAKIEVNMYALTAAEDS